MKKRKNNIFLIFSEKCGKMLKKSKMMKIGQILMKRVNIDEK